MLAGVGTGTALVHPPYHRAHSSSIQKTMPSLALAEGDVTIQMSVNMATQMKNIKFNKTGDLTLTCLLQYCELFFTHSVRIHGRYSIHFPSSWSQNNLF